MATAAQLQPLTTPLLVVDQPKAQESRILYRVGKHAPGLHTYPAWARWLIRFVYFVTGYQVTSQDIAIASDEEIARAMCIDSNYFYKPLYLDFPLSEEQCAPGPVVWPHSEANGFYQKFYPDGVYITKEHFDLLSTTVDRVSQ